MSELSKRRLINAQIKWAEKSGRHEDMLNNVRALIKEASAQGFELSPDERNFVSFAYKNVVSELRQQWRTLVQTELKWLDGDTENESGENREENEEKSGQSTARSRQSSAAARRDARRRRPAAHPAPAHGRGGRAGAAPCAA